MWPELSSVLVLMVTIRPAALSANSGLSSRHICPRVPQLCWNPAGFIQHACSRPYLQQTRSKRASVAVTAATDLSFHLIFHKKMHKTSQSFVLFAGELQERCYSKGKAAVALSRPPAGSTRVTVLVPSGGSRQV